MHCHIEWCPAKKYTTWKTVEESLAHAQYGRARIGDIDIILIGGSLVAAASTAMLSISTTRVAEHMNMDALWNLVCGITRRDHDILIHVHDSHLHTYSCTYKYTTCTITPAHPWLGTS